MATYYLGTTAALAVERLEKRLSAQVVRRIYDDNNDGDADASPLLQVCEDAEARFESFCAGIYDLAALRTAPSTEAIRLCLDCAEAMAYRRFPRAAARDWLPLWQAVETELKDLRSRKSELNTQGTPEPAANDGGGFYVQGTEDTTEQPETFMHEGFGDF
jgi:phage gp36-like protein